MTFMQLMEKFPTEKAVIDYYVKIRYGENAVCNHCGSTKVYQRSERPKTFDCNDCENTFSPFKETIFEKSRTDLRKWMFAIYMFLNGKKGISGLQLQREIGVTYKTAWRILHQIRIAMANVEQSQFVYTIVEIDETYIGGKPIKSNHCIFIQELYYLASNRLTTIRAINYLLCFQVVFINVKFFIAVIALKYNHKILLK